MISAFMPAGVFADTIVVRGIWNAPKKVKVKLRWGTVLTCANNAQARTVPKVNGGGEKMEYIKNALTKVVIRKIASVSLIVLIALCFMALINTGEAHAEAKNAGTITLDFTKDQVRLSGDQLEAFNNVMPALYAKDQIWYLDFFGDPRYSLDKNNDYDFARHDGSGYSEFYMLEDPSIEGEWSIKNNVDPAVFSEIIDSLISEGKSYCDDIRVIFPEAYYDVWVEGERLNSINAKDVKGDGTVKYDPAAKTLTLDGASFKTNGLNAGSNYAILSLYDLNIVLKGTNRIETGIEPTAQTIVGAEARSLNISGSGTLEVEIKAKGRDVYGVRASHENLVLDGITVRVNVENESPEKRVVGAYSASYTNIINGANLSIVSKCTVSATNRVYGLSAYGFSVDEYSILESKADNYAAAPFKNGCIEPDTVSRGALVNTDASAEGAVEWDKSESIMNYKYVRMPFKHEKHHWDTGSITKDAACTEKGVMTYTCTACGETRTEEIPAKGHKYGAWTKSNESEHQRVCEHDKTHVEKEAHKWDSGKVTKEATAGSEGVKTFTCSVCGAARTESIPKKDPAPAPAPAPAPDKDIDNITPSDAAIENAAVDKKLAVNVNSIATGAKMNKKTMTIKWKKVKGATNYKIAYRLAGKKWTEKWTKGKNSITLNKLKKNGLYEFKLMAVKKSGSAWTKSKWSKVNYRFFANTTEKLKAIKKGAKVTVKKVKKGSGYDAQYALKKASIKNGKIKSFKGAKKVKLSIKGLKAKKAYFVRTRPYKTYKGHKYIGIWNAPKKVKTK